MKRAKQFEMSGNCSVLGEFRLSVGYRCTLSKVPSLGRLRDASPIFRGKSV